MKWLLVLLAVANASPGFGVPPFSENPAGPEAPAANPELATASVVRLPAADPAAGRSAAVVAHLTIPLEFAAESGVYCQRRIGLWTLSEARALLGEPLRTRAAADPNDAGVVYAFRDPSGRYREVELDFPKNGALRAAFLYPWDLTWEDCRRLWGAKVNPLQANKGRIFYSYLDRRLDVLVAPGGRVISLGLY